MHCEYINKNRQLLILFKTVVCFLFFHYKITMEKYLKYYIKYRDMLKICIAKYIFKNYICILYSILLFESKHLTKTIKFSPAAVFAVENKDGIYYGK